jgi:hypothetical protein
LTAPVRGHVFTANLLVVGAVTVFAGISTTPASASPPSPGSSGSTGTTAVAPSLPASQTLEPVPNIEAVQLHGLSLTAHIGAGGGPCRMTLTLDARAKRVGLTTVMLDAGESKSVTVRLNGTGQELLKSRHTLSVNLIVTIGNLVFSRRTVTFREP